MTALTRCLAVFTVLVSVIPSVTAASTLDTIRQRGQLLCGVSTGVAGFSAPDSKNRWSGLDVDVCRAVAAAVLKSPDKVRFVPLKGAKPG